MELEQQLRAALARCEPGPDPMAAVMAQLQPPGARASRGRKRGRRSTILVGSILVFAAAAAVLAPHLDDEPASTPEAAPQASALAAGAPETPVIAPSIQPSPAPREVARNIHGARTFTVRVSLNEDNANNAVTAALRTIRTALLDRLRLVPGVKLLDADSTGAAAEEPDYNIVLLGSAPDPQGTFRAGISAGAGSARQLAMTGASIAPRCAGQAAGDLLLLLPDESACADPASVAAFMVGFLRKQIFPPEPMLQQQLQAQLLNRALDAGQRLLVLGDLARERSRAATAASPEGLSARAQSDAAFVQGALHLAATSGDPAIRAQIWRMMRGLGHSDLVQPLVAASLQDADAEARLEAATTLARDFSSDEPVRSALATVARQDSRALIRAAAQRGLTGEAAWKQYIAASLKDASRSDAERTEALMHHVFERNLPDSFTSNTRNIRALLDDGGIQALAQVLPRLQVPRGSKDSQRERMVFELTYAASQIIHPAITDMLLNIARDHSGSRMGESAVELLMDRIDDPRVRIALEQINSADSDRRRREGATPAQRSPRTRAGAR